jgi:hypothetical protein
MVYEVGGMERDSRMDLEARRYSKSVAKVVVLLRKSSAIYVGEPIYCTSLV